MRKIKKGFNAGYQVYDWMAADMKLSGAKRDVFALVFAFGVAGREYYGSLSATAKRLGISDNTAERALKTLVAADLLVKTVVRRKGCRQCVYGLAPAILDHYTETSPKMGDMPSTKRGNPSPMMGDNNKQIYANPPIRSISYVDARDARTHAPSLLDEEPELTPEVVAHNNGQLIAGGEKKEVQQVDLVATLVGLGVTRETAECWALVRKKARAVNTTAAATYITQELAKLAEAGITAEYAVNFVAAQSWRGLKANWILDEIRKDQAPAGRAYGRPESAETSRYDQMMAKLERARQIDEQEQFNKQHFGF